MLYGAVAVDERAPVLASAFLIVLADGGVADGAKIRIWMLAPRPVVSLAPPAAGLAAGSRRGHYRVFCQSRTRLAQSMALLRSLMPLPLYAQRQMYLKALAHQKMTIGGIAIRVALESMAASAMSQVMKPSPR